MKFDIIYKIFLFALLAGLIYYFAMSESEAKAQELLPDVGYMYYHDIDAIVIDNMLVLERCLVRECESIFFDVKHNDEMVKLMKGGNNAL